MSATWKGAMERCWTGLGEYCEIVQIGAFKLDWRRCFADTNEFGVLGKLKINPNMSDYFVELIGITQERVEAEGLVFPEALAAFHGFVGNDRPVYRPGAPDSGRAELKR